jgi:hypothetical protein
LRRCQYCGEFIAPLPTEKSNILGIKSSLSHWLHFQKKLYSATVVNKRPRHWHFFPNSQHSQQPYKMAV